jgi:hypothetical protein
VSASLRQQIVDAITSRLQEIRIGKVYQLPDGPYTCENDIKGVYPWRKVPFSKAEIPAIKLDDTSAETSAGPASQHQHKLTFSLEVIVAGSSSASTVRSILADVVAAIGSDPKWNRLAFWTELDGHNIDVEQAGDIIAGAQLQITVTYRTSLWRM